MKPEDRLLFLCTRQTFTDDHLHALLDLCRRQPIQWEDVFFTAKQHAVAPLVGANLERAIAAGLEVPPDIVHKFQLATIRNVAAKGKRTEKLAKVLAFLSARSIAAMAVKSAAVDLLVYEQPWYTTAADTDLILRLREPKVPIEQAELPCSATGGVACPDADRHRGAASAGKSPEPEVSDQTHAELAHFFYQKATEYEFWHGSESRKVRLTLLKTLREISLDVRPSKWLLITVKSNEMYTSGFVSLYFDKV